MKQVFQFTLRNIKVYLRDPVGVFFSFLSMLIILGLYILFLGDVSVNNMPLEIPNVSEQNIRFLVDSWIMAGILIVNSITIPLGVFGIMVQDRARKTIDGFLVAPVKRWKLIMGYILGAVIVGIILNSISLIIIELYIIINGGEILSLIAIFKVILLIILNVFSSTCLMFFFISFIKTMTGFSTLSSIVGTLIGFITGIYIPLGILPNLVRTIAKLVPATHGVALMRLIFMERPMTIVFANVDKAIQHDYLETQGAIINLFGYKISPIVMILYLLLTSIIFLLLSVLVINHKKNK
jgi:multidrug/hemolysin transport system permease protein